MTHWVIPREAVAEVALLDDDDPLLLNYQQTLWTRLSLLRARCTETALKANIAVHGAQVLDLGCGAGLRSCYLIESGAEAVTAVDDDPDELAYARTHHTLPGIAYRQLDVLEPLPFPAKTFDVVFVADGFIDFYTPAVLDDMRRVCKDDGQIIFATTNIVPPVQFGWDRAFASRIEAARWQALGATAYGDRIDAGTSYEALFYRACAVLDLHPQHIVIDYHAPFATTDPYPALILQNFAAFTGRMLRPYLSDDDWERLLAYHDPLSARYMLARGHFAQTLTLAKNIRF